MKIEGKKVAIIGSRGISPMINLSERPAMIISGGARGVDTCAAKYAESQGIPLLEIRPDYARYGQGAPHVRNRQIVAECDVMIAYWDGKSSGTKSTVAFARKQGKTVYVICEKPDPQMALF